MALRAGALASVVVAVIVGIGGWQFNVWRLAPLTLDVPRSIQIAPGSSAIQIIEQLSASGIMTDPLMFRLLIEVTGHSNQIQAGEYEFVPGISPHALLMQMVEGEVVTYEVMIPEGITVQVLLEMLDADPRLAGLAPGTRADNLAERLSLSVPFLEGYFLADTYQFRRGDSVEDILHRAHEAMVSELAAAWSSRAPACDLPSSTELLVLASIIEKETGDARDRNKISQVFHERLRKGMRLQTDPTVIYALGNRFDGDLRRRDLKLDSPFNTYRVKGLPPTPIALPSRAALKAAAHPAETEYLYFVARGDGTSYFSRTLEEHNAAVRKYQLSGQ